MRGNIEALIDNADTLADQLESYDPKAEDFDAPLSALMASKLAAFQRNAADQDPGR